MSIIHDALKRAQNEFKKKDGPKEKAAEAHETPKIYDKLRSKTTPPIKSPESEAQPKAIDEQLAIETITQKKKLNVTFIVLIAIFSLFIGIFVSFLIVLLNQSQTRNSVDMVVQKQPVEAQSIETQPVQKPTAPIAKAQPAPAPAPAPTPSTGSVKKKDLQLSGTMMMGEKHVALINGEIYELGETIRGKKITSITLKDVELTDENGETSYLTVSRKE